MSKPRPIPAKTLSVLLRDVFPYGHPKQGFPPRPLFPP